MSWSYKQGFITGFKSALLSLRKYNTDDNLFDNMINEYNKLPLIEKINVKESLK